MQTALASHARLGRWTGFLNGMHCINGCHALSCLGSVLLRCPSNSIEVPFVPYDLRMIGIITDLNVSVIFMIYGLDAEKMYKKLLP